MSDPIAVMLRFSGDPEDLLGRFEQARKSWIEARDGDFDSPLFFAICKAEEAHEQLTIAGLGWGPDDEGRPFGRPSS